MDKKYGFILKFQDCAENEIEIYSDEAEDDENTTKTTCEIVEIEITEREIFELS